MVVSSSFGSVGLGLSLLRNGLGGSNFRTGRDVGLVESDLVSMTVRRGAGSDVSVSTAVKISSDALMLSLEPSFGTTTASTSVLVGRRILLTRLGSV